jgi:hypothetical protein
MQYNFNITESALLTHEAADRIRVPLEDHLVLQKSTDLASVDLSAVEVMSEVFATDFFGQLTRGPISEIRLCDKGCVLFAFNAIFGYHVEVLGAKPAVVKVIEASFKQLAFEVINSDLGEEFRKGAIRLSAVDE